MAGIGTVVARLIVGRGAARLLAPPSTTPDEATLKPQVDELGGEVVRFRSRDGGRLAGRWLTATPGSAGWEPDPHEAILLLHGWSGSIAPDLVEYGPFLRRTAGVLGVDFLGHGESDPGPTTFGWREVEDVAGALAWLAERGIGRVAVLGTSMGGMTALASVVVLGDGSLPSADREPDAPAHDIAAPAPRIVAIVADSVAARATTAVANRMRLPLRGFLAAMMFDVAGERVGADLRATEPIRIIGLVESLPVLLVHGTADRTVRPKDGRRLAAGGGTNVEHWEVRGGTHSGNHAAAPAEYEQRVETFLRAAFAEARSRVPIIGAPVPDETPNGGGQEGD
jgi:pimeloyl-ACP methyl ester carboxylesterase